MSILGKIKQLSKETAIYGVSTIVGRFLQFLLVPLYTNLISRNDFGIYTQVYVIVAFLNIAYIYGMDAAFMKYATHKKGREKREAFSTPFWLVTFSTLFLTTIFYLLSDNVASLASLPGNYHYLMKYVVFILFFDTLALIPFADLRLENRPVKFATIKLFNIFINLSLNLILIVVYDFGIEAIFISNLAASVFSLVALLPDIAKKLSFNFNRELFNKLIKFGLPYLPASLTSMMVQMIDVPILERLTNFETVGLYRANYKLGVFMMLFVVMFNYAWQPFFLSNANEKNAKEIFSKVLTVFVFIAGFIWLGLSVFIDDIVSIQITATKTLIGQDFISGFYIVPLVLLGYLFHGIYFNFAAGIYIEEKTKYLPYVSGLGAIVNVVVNLLLIPVWGILGAAFATFASYFVMAIGLYYFANKVYPVKYEWGKIFVILATIGIIISVYYSVVTSNGLPFVYKFVFPVGYLLSIFIFRAIRFSELKILLNSLQRKK